MHSDKELEGIRGDVDVQVRDLAKLNAHLLEEKSLKEDKRQNLRHIE